MKLIYKSFFSRSLHAGLSQSQHESAGVSRSQPESAAVSRSARVSQPGVSRSQPESAGVSRSQPESAGQPQSAATFFNPPSRHPELSFPWLVFWWLPKPPTPWRQATDELGCQIYQNSSGGFEMVASPLWNRDVYIHMWTCIYTFMYI